MTHRNQDWVYLRRSSVRVASFDPAGIRAKHGTAIRAYRHAQKPLVTLPGTESELHLTMQRSEAELPYDKLSKPVPLPAIANSARMKTGQMMKQPLLAVLLLAVLVALSCIAQLPFSTLSLLSPSAFGSLQEDRGVKLARPLSGAKRGLLLQGITSDQKESTENTTGEAAARPETKRRTWKEMSADERIEFRKAHGNNLAGAQVSQASKRGILKRLIYSSRTRMIFCPIPKVANSAWKYMIRKIDGMDDKADIQIVNDRSKSGLTYLVDFPVDEAADMLEDDSIMKVVFVRDPLPRAVSAFLNKFVQKEVDSQEYDLYMKHLFGERFFKRADTTPAKYGRITFGEFARRVEMQTAYEMNEHWAPQTFLCGMDVIPYDYIGHFERMKEDSSFILQTLGQMGLSLPTPEEINFLSTGASKASSTYFTPALTQIWQQKFAQDFSLLGYDSTKDGRAS
ncbi:Carbohydrate sulfotransferase 14 [Porphyridium purpureum]|uniref:Carbohydrate sulfotransferase 14 n=1 Tax=Porphyridium purpureum TaxID=35688 RepID=A0A5J4YN43_PORPP|nr:Carbohydrate sulfotransferase 14 [Porphyridium purpureum]|eukprot:POR9646..scf244_11